MAENRPKMGPKMAQKRAKIRPFLPLWWQSPGGVGVLRPLPSSYCAISVQRRARDAAARARRGRGGWPESPFGEVRRAGRGPGRHPESVSRQGVRGLAPPGGYSLRHAGRVRLPTHRVLAALRPERLTRRADAHTTFLAARKACYPAAGRHQRVSPTLGETLCWTSCPSTEDKKCVRPTGLTRGERSARGKKIFFLTCGEKNFFSPRKNLGIGNFFRACPEKISTTEIFSESRVV